MNEISKENNNLMKQNEIQKQKISLYLIEISEYRREVKYIANIKEDLLLTNALLKKKLNFYIQNLKGNRIYELETNQSKEALGKSKRNDNNDNVSSSVEPKKDRYKANKDNGQSQKIIDELNKANNFYRLNAANLDSKFAKMTSAYEGKISNLMKENEILSKRIKNYDESPKELNSPQKNIYVLKSLLSENEKKMKQYEEKANEMDDINKHQKEEIGILGEQIRSLTDQITNLKKEKKRWEMEIENFIKLIDKHCIEYDYCIQEKELYKLKATTLEKSLNRLENSIKKSTLTEPNTIFHMKEYVKSPEIEFFEKDKTNSIFNTPLSHKNLNSTPFRKSFIFEKKQVNLSFDSFQPQNIFQSNQNAKKCFINNKPKKRFSRFTNTLKKFEKNEENIESSNIDSNIKEGINDNLLPSLKENNLKENLNDIEEESIIRIIKTLYRFNISLNEEEIDNCII